jgi:hypothetical protein
VLELADLSHHQLHRYRETMLSPLGAFCPSASEGGSKRIGGVPVLGDRSRNKPPVERVCDADRKRPRDREDLKVGIIGEFDRHGRASGLSDASADPKIS